MWQVLGYDVGFPIGVPASVLTATSDWIEYYGRNGFNVLTYKTVRSSKREAHPGVNWVFLKGLETPVDPAEGLPSPVIGGLTEWPASPRNFSMANSFGVPSSDPEEWQADVRHAVRLLRSDQLLIVSVMGTYEEYQGEELVQDFVRVARLAEDAGAPAVELNLSCPNTIDSATGAVKDQLICESVEDSARIVEAVRLALRPETKLVIKLGYMKETELEALILRLFRDERLIDAIAGINTIQATVQQEDGSATFVGTCKDAKATRKLAGVSGTAIRKFGLEFVRSLAAIRTKHQIQYDIIGMGGVMDAEDVLALMRAGAAAVQTATAAFFNPSLPQEVYARLGGTPESDSDLEARSRIIELLENKPKTVREVAESIKGFFPSQWVLYEKTRSLLRTLEAEGVVQAARNNGQTVFAVNADQPLQLAD